MDNYKGIYYNESKDPKIFEGGAHFRYKDLYNILLSLGGQLQNDSNHTIHINKHINEKIYNNAVYKLEKEKEKKMRPKTRNITNFNYINNPNTKISINPNKVHKKTINNFNGYNDQKNIINFNNNLGPKTQRYHNNNDILKSILRHKINNKKSAEKVGTDSYNIYNYFKFLHQKNKSETFINNNNKNVDKNEYIKKTLIFQINTNAQPLTNRYLSKKINLRTNMEEGGEAPKIFKTAEKVSKMSKIRKNKNNCLMIYDKSRANLTKSKKDIMTTGINLPGKNLKKSRNIINKNLFIFGQTDFNLNNNNNNEETNTNFSSMINNNNTCTNDKGGLYINKNCKNIMLQKYVKKKIGRCAGLGLGQDKSKKNGKKICSRNVNSNHNYKLGENDLKFKTTSEINNININANKFNVF